ncbi:unnamed protein product [Bursaphelenchus xylophilus]|uniref:(pine wood nematode) hypothetical protein n=1 Tax=Bursaphelenchus xylophilus TaxID=6326 RepID=A0A1I7RR79_BURXY|nr:unnamed protein product [Bursaphelenchus xylophilus]CAG9130868.1 unnamed protein product [Bursaphelenchus xylophilus]
MLLGSIVQTSKKLESACPPLHDDEVNSTKERIVPLLSMSLIDGANVEREQLWRGGASDGESGSGPDGPRLHPPTHFQSQEVGCVLAFLCQARGPIHSLGLDPDRWHSSMACTHRP